MNRTQEKLQIKRCIEQHPCVILKGPNELLLNLVLENLREAEVDPADQVALDNKNHPDVIIVDSRELGVEAVRSLLQELSAHPARWKFRYLILLYVERLNLNSSQTLLKTLEEPPKTLRIFLISGDPEVLPETVLSRSILLTFQRPSEQEVVQVLTALGKDEPVWRAQVSCLDLDAAVDLDLEITKEWHKLFSAVLAGCPLPPDFAFTWSEKLKDVEGSKEVAKKIKEATQIACMNLFISFFSKKAINVFAQTACQYAHEERERLKHNKSNFMEWATTLVFIYAYIKGYLKSRNEGS